MVAIRFSSISWNRSFPALVFVFVVASLPLYKYNPCKNHCLSTSQQRYKPFSSLFLFSLFVPSMAYSCSRHISSPPPSSCKQFHIKSGWVFSNFCFYTPISMMIHTYHFNEDWFVVCCTVYIVFIFTVDCYFFFSFVFILRKPFEAILLSNITSQQYTHAHTHTLTHIFKLYIHY